MGQATVVGIVSRNHIDRMNTAGWSKARWMRHARAFVRTRRGIAGAKGTEFVAGYLDGFKAVYAKAYKLDGEPWYVWFVSPGQPGHTDRVVNELMPGVYVDHEGTVIEWDPEWTLVIGTVTRVGDEPLLTAEMLKRG